MSTRISITQTEGADYPITVFKADGKTEQALDEGGAWELHFKAKLKVTDAGAPLIVKASTTATQILIDPDQANNPGEATLFLLASDSTALVIKPHAFDLYAIEPVDSKKRYLVTSGVLDVKRYIADS